MLSNLPTERSRWCLPVVLIKDPPVLEAVGAPSLHDEVHRGPLEHLYQHEVQLPAQVHVVLVEDATRREVVIGDRVVARLREGEEHIVVVALQVHVRRP